ncbi:hypothetical protein [Duganella qianjiadongensis]|uniref:DUF4426 domain-containing protein n=1 Tax=Duganella qianjiadongensis TaxID=2692176 RepID=A0ABW9VKG0_9BURK|nr:hypothetical protein [Duganella qianjiadongensis]MYM39950.1 hypothetical protein [Duganella qianjiadongensis]
MKKHKWFGRLCLIAVLAAGVPLAAQAQESAPKDMRMSCLHSFVARLIAGESPDKLAKLMVVRGAQSSTDLAAGLRIVLQETGKLSQLQPLLKFPAGESKRLLVGLQPESRSYLAESFSAQSEKHGTVQFMLTRELEGECAITSLAMHTRR